MPPPIGANTANLQTGLQIEGGSAEALTNLVAHLFAELLPARRPFRFGDVEAVEHVEIFQDRVVVAGHCQDTKQFGRRPAGAGDFPPPDGVAAIGGREAA